MSYAPVPTEDNATSSTTAQPMTYVFVPIEAPVDTAVASPPPEEPRFYGLRAQEADVVAWLLCLFGYFFFFPWFCGLLCMRARSRVARAGGFTSAVCLLISLIALLIFLLLLLFNHDFAEAMFSRSRRHSK